MVEPSRSEERLTTTARTTDTGTAATERRARLLRLRQVRVAQARDVAGSEGPGSDEEARTTAPPGEVTEAGTVTTDVAAEETTQAAEVAEVNPVTQLAHDFNNVPVWNAGELAPEHAPATHYRTPYLLNSVAECAEASSIRALRVAAGRPNAGQTVSQAVGSRPFVGKGTPAQMQIIAQAVVDNAFDGQTPDTIQAYVNNGRLRTGTRRNGKWGVDCSGFTSQLMHEMEGNGREGFESTNAASFQHDGSRGYTPVDPDTARRADIISYQTTNHVVVVSDRWDVQLSMVGGSGTRTQRAVKMGVAESTATQDPASQQYVRTDRVFYYFPGARQVMGANNLTGPTWRFASVPGQAQPVFQAELGATSYSGQSSWTADYTLNCPTDRQGTNIRVRESNGSFTTTRQRVANGASGVELREVEGTMVRIRVNGQEMLDGKEMWAPVSYVASFGAGYSIPSTGQPTDMSASTYSFVRNPNLTQPNQPPESEQ